MRPTRQYAALPVVPLGSKDMADCRELTTHHLAFFGGLTYVHSNFFLLLNKNDVPLLLAPERVVPIVEIVTTSHGHTCDVHRFISGNALLLARTHEASVNCCVFGFIVASVMEPDELAACFVLGDYFRI